MERSEIINEIFDALYALPVKESLDIASWGMENLNINNEDQIYNSIIDEFLMNYWAEDRGQGLLALTHEGREMIDTFGSYNGFVETYTIPERKSPKKSRKKVSAKRIILIFSLILVPFIALFLLTKNNDDKIIVEKKSKIENQKSESIEQKSKIAPDQKDESKKIKNKIENQKSESVELKSKIVPDQKSEIEELKSMIKKQKSEIEKQRNKIKKQKTDIEEQITIIGSLQNVLNNR